MKNPIIRFLPIATLMLLFSACAPQLNFLGDTYPPTNQVDTYYAEADILRKYRVMGQLSGSNQGVAGVVSLQEIQQSMIEEAKKRGAHGILFLFTDSFGQEHIVKADLIRYLD